MPARTRLSVAIQHHPRRADLLPALTAALAGAELEVVTDPHPDHHRSPWRTYAEALRLTPAWATHRLILQDDVTPCHGFAPAAQRAVLARPNRVLSFFTAGNPYEHAQAVYKAAEEGWSWAEVDHFRWCSAVATCWPADQCARILEWVAAQNWPVTFCADDEIIGRYLRATQQLALASVPSLIQHEDAVPSLIGRRAANGQDRGRVAACWIGDCDPATIDWTLGPE